MRRHDAGRTAQLGKRSGSRVLDVGGAVQGTTMIELTVEKKLHLVNLASRVDTPDEEATRAEIPRLQMQHSSLGVVACPPSKDNSPKIPPSSEELHVKMHIKMTLILVTRTRISHWSQCFLGPITFSVHLVLVLWCCRNEAKRANSCS